MKAIVTLCVMAVAGALGFLIEPELRPMLTGEKAGIKKNSDGSAQPTHIKLNELSLDQLPKFVMIKKQVQYQSSGITFSIPSGSLAELKGVEGDQVNITPKGSQDIIQVPISETDLVEQLKANPPTSTPVTNNPPPAPVVPDVPVTPAPQPPATTNPGTVASNNPPPVTPAPTPTPTPTPTIPEPPPVTPTPQPKPPVSPAGPLQAVSDSEVVQLMKASIANKQIQEFSSDQVTEWTPGENQTIDNVTYQTGTAFYTTTTPFGSTTMKAKALIHNGKVVRWIWPHTGIELK